MAQPKPEALVEACLRAAIWLSRRPVIGRGLVALGSAASYIFTAMAPAVPPSLRGDGDRTHGWETFGIAFAISLFFALGLNGFFSYLSGTFSGPNGCRDYAEIAEIYFLCDRWNLLLYAVVVPAYVGIASCLIGTTVANWHKIRSFSDRMSRKASDARDKRRFITFLTLSLILVALFITNYIRELAAFRPKSDAAGAPDSIYWFMVATPSGHKILNEAGAYYLVFNAALLFITLIALFCLISMSVEIVRIGRSLKANNANIDAIVSNVAAYSHCYFLAQLLILAYVANVYIWGISPAGRMAKGESGMVVNIEIAAIALIAIGFFVISFPRYFIDLRLKQIATRIHANALGPNMKYYAPDISIIPKARSRVQKFAVFILGSGLLGTFALFWIKERWGLGRLGEDLLARLSNI